MTTVVIPFYRHSSVQRAAVLARVTDHLHDGGLETRLFGVLPGEPWSPGAARNNGFDHVDDDPVVFNDADTIVPANQIRAAVLLAQATGSLVYAYDLYLRRTRLGAIERELFMPPSVGCVAISRASFQDVGGFDELYQGWGYEDVDFAQRCAGRVGVRRITGTAEHLWHGDRRRDDSPEDSDAELVALNLQRFRAGA
jgi:N-terminal domain of galactosyltransferase